MSHAGSPSRVGRRLARSMPNQRRRRADSAASSSWVDHREAALVGDREDLVHVTRISRPVHRQDGLGPGRDPARDIAGVDVSREILDVGVDRSRPPGEDDVTGRDEGLRGGDHLVVRADAGEREREAERRGPAVHGDGVTRLRELGDLGLELAHDRPVADVAAPQRGDGTLDGPLGDVHGEDRDPLRRLNRGFHMDPAFSGDPRPPRARRRRLGAGARAGLPSRSAPFSTTTRSR